MAKEGKTECMSATDMWYSGVEEGLNDGDTLESVLIACHPAATHT